MFWKTSYLVIGCLLFFSTARGGIVVQDDTGRTLTLISPARRIVSMAPHATELLFAAGAGNTIVGVVDYSDYPEAAQRIRRIGSGAGLDLEAIASLQPDLIVAWQSGNSAWQVQQLARLGFPVFITEPRRIGDVAGLLERIGKLAGTETMAGKAAADFRLRLAALHSRYAQRPVITVLYQILDNSLITVNGRHFINDVIQTCGGKNVFSEQPGLTPRVDLESVLRRNPEVILAGGSETFWIAWRERWKIWTVLDAVAQDNLYWIPPDLIHRNSPRILAGAERVCAALDRSRSKQNRADIR
jgi:iron complex transport system substrate-binding protein